MSQMKKNFAEGLGKCSHFRSNKSSSVITFSFCLLFQGNVPRGRNRKDNQLKEYKGIAGEGWGDNKKTAISQQQNISNNETERTQSTLKEKCLIFKSLLNNRS